MTTYYFNDNQKNILRMMARGLQDGSVEPTWTLVKTFGGIVPMLNLGPDLSREIAEHRLQQADLDIFIESGFMTRIGDIYKLRRTKIIEVANNDFEDPIYIELEPVQIDLLFALVEAARNVPIENRKEFRTGSPLGIGDVVYHSGFNGAKKTVSFVDLRALNRQNLISIFDQSQSSYSFDITPSGYKFYKQLKRQMGQPIEQVTTTVRDYLDAHQFRQNYAQAYAKWLDAEERLFGTEVDKQLTTIGHLCREAVQEFATVLVEKYQPPNASEDKTKTVNRVREVLNLRTEELGETEKPFLDALLAYWGTLSDLIQRQEHGGQKEGSPLVWEDARRAVFQTAVVMFEIDRALSR